MTKMKAYLNQQRVELSRTPFDKNFFAMFLAAQPYKDAAISVIGTRRVCLGCGESYIAPYTTTTKFIAREKAFRAAHSECQTIRG